LGFEVTAYPQRQRLLRSLQAAETITAENAINNIAVQAVNTPARGKNTSKNKILEAKLISGKQIGELIHAARVKAVEKMLLP
jgi:hypothetical protein